MSKFLSYTLESHKELGLMALAASPTPEAACEFLKAEYELMTKPAQLANLAKYNREQFEELRERIAPLKETQLAHNLLDNALYASEVTAQAIEQLQKRVAKDLIKGDQLSRVARDLADVQAKAVDKRLALTGRPTVITETRDAAEIIRALESKGIVKQIGDVTADV